MRSSTIAAWRLPANRWLDLSVAASSVVVASIVFVPVGHEVFATTGLDLTETLIVGVLAILPLTGIELLKRRSGADPAVCVNVETPCDAQ